MSILNTGNLAVWYVQLVKRMHRMWWMLQECGKAVSALYQLEDWINRVQVGLYKCTRESIVLSLGRVIVDDF